VRGFQQGEVIAILFECESVVGFGVRVAVAVCSAWHANSE
jgi:hypothetical protein